MRNGDDTQFGAVPVIDDTVELKVDLETRRSGVENGDMDVDNKEPDAENVEIDMGEDSASEEDDECTPSDVAMDVDPTCDEVCANSNKKYLSQCQCDYMTEEEDDPDDMYKPEGTIYLDIDGFSQFCEGSSETQQRLSKPVFVRGLPWKILAIPRDAVRVGTGARSNKALGFFLQCNGDSEAVAWNCVASASLKVLCQVDGFEDVSRRITHTFYPKENDWGYSQFLTCDQLMNPENGFIKDDTIRLVVHVSADAPHGVHHTMVMNYTEAENLVYEATNEDPWGPSSPQMKEIANYTFQYEGFHQVMNLLWKRMLEDNKNAWRRVYKSLTLLNHLLLHGSKRVIGSARDHTFQMRALEQYKYVDDHGRDQGLNVRRMVKLILDLVGDDDKLRAQRRKVKSDNKDRYQGYTSEDIRMGRGGSYSRGLDRDLATIEALTMELEETKRQLAVEKESRRQEVQLLESTLAQFTDLNILASEHPRPVQEVRPLK